MKIDDVYGKEYTFVDVRSPKEFGLDHIPGAVNIPLFSDDERAIVGTIYSKESKERAMDVGLEIASKKLPSMIEVYKKLEQPLCVYCWRGGMRSGSVVSLLKSLGFDVIQLENGYKDYRRYVREELEKVIIPPLVVLYGLTGSGKTEIIQQIDDSVDLEGLAKHRGSIFGDIHLQHCLDWANKICSEISLKCIEPLWAQNPEYLINEFVDLGFEAVIVSTQANLLGEEWIGRKIDKNFISELKEKEGIDLCGENGEFHTFVTYGPMFKKRIDIVKSRKIYRDGFWFLDINKYQIY